jgi:hypothetical protein
MKRKILEITEIDCGDELCGGCRYCNNSGHPPRCKRFWIPFSQALNGKAWIKPPRIDECLEAESLMQQAIDSGIIWRFADTVEETS